MAKVRSRLLNPFALVGQGFLAGGIVFWTTRADAAAYFAAIF